MRRAGERGEGTWQQISWDEALTDIAEAMLDTMQAEGPESIVRIGTPGQGGTQSIALAGAVFNKLGCTMTDVQGEINDWNPGIYTTFGRFDPCASNDDWFHSDVILIWANNPGVQRHPARPLHQRSTLPRRARRDRRPGLQPFGDPRRHLRAGAHRQRRRAGAGDVPGDPRREHLMDRAFVREQTDLPLLVRTDTGRFLRQQDVVADGRDDIFYLFDKHAQQIVEAPRRLDLGEIVPGAARYVHGRSSPAARALKSNRYSCASSGVSRTTRRRRRRPSAASIRT